MKNLKRVLSLALATVMVIGMMVVGANAAFSDQSSIKYTNAVDTLVQLGVMNGMGDNTFAPNGTLTRAQAAKMVAYVKSGANATTISYYDGTTKFTDVTANHNWASGSINYCVANGIVTGMTATTFAPDASLTGAQLAKMMLVALGYPEKSENATQTLVGANWQLNAIRLATEAGLFKGLDSDFAATRAITRQEAAQIMYNALFLSTWRIKEYQNATPVYDQQGDPLLVSAFKANPGTTSSDDFRRPATQYTFTDGKDPIVVVNTPVLTYTTAVTEQKLYNDLALDGTSKSISVTANGNTASTVTLTRATTTALSGTGNGVLTEVYKDTAGNITVVEINTYLAKVGTVTKANATTGEKASAALSVYTAADTATPMTYATEAFAKDSFVLVTKSNKTGTDTVKSVVAATKVSNVAVTKYSATELVAGSTYNYAATLFANTSAGILASNFAFGGTYDLYLDQYGYVIGNQVYTAAGTQLNYIYVNAQEAKEQTSSITAAAAGTVAVKGYLMDGSEVVLNVQVKTAAADIKLDSNKVQTAGAAVTTIAKGTNYIELGNGHGTDTVLLSLANGQKSTVEGALANGLYSYTTNTDGTIVLSKKLSSVVGSTTYTGAVVASTAGNTITVQKNVASLGANVGGKLANSATKLVLVGKDGTVTTTTGYGNFAATATTYTCATTPSADKEYTTAIMIDDGVNANTIVLLGVYSNDVTADNVYGIGLDTSYKVSENGAVVEYKEFLVNGKTVAYKGAAANTKNAIYEIAFNADGTVTATAIASASITTKKVNQEVTAVTADYIVVDGVAISLNGVTVYNVTTNNSVDTIEKGDHVTVVYSTKDNVNTAVAAFIVG